MKKKFADLRTGTARKFAKAEGAHEFADFFKKVCLPTSFGFTDHSRFSAIVFSNGLNKSVYFLKSNESCI
jgi:hypothetical protein